MRAIAGFGSPRRSWATGVLTAACAGELDSAAPRPCCHPEATDASRGARKAATATEYASLGSFLFDRPVPNRRTRAVDVPATHIASDLWASRLTERRGSRIEHRSMRVRSGYIARRQRHCTSRIHRVVSCRFGISSRPARPKSTARILRLTRRRPRVMLARNCTVESRFSCAEVYGEYGRHGSTDRALPGR
jgi:hypothetical protein